jgi:hypothetical protein
VKKSILAFAATAALAAVFGASPVAASGGADVRVKGVCSGSSSSSLKLSTDDLGLEVQLEVEGPAAASWAITLTDNGHTVFSRTKTANGAGVVRVHRIIRDRPGTDTVTASAQNLASGETCTATASI